MKKTWYLSKLNWAGILLILIAILPIIQNQNFSGMNVKDWIVFVMGIAVIILRTYFTNTGIGKTPKP